MLEKEKFVTPELEKLLEDYELSHIHTDVIEKAILLVIASFGLITALAWDTFLSNFFKRLFGGQQTLLEEVSYALVITAIAALVSVVLGKHLKSRKSNELKKQKRLRNN